MLTIAEGIILAVVLLYAVLVVCGSIAAGISALTDRLMPACVVGFICAMLLFITIIIYL